MSRWQVSGWLGDGSGSADKPRYISRMRRDRVSEAPKLGLWGRLKRLALTDVGAMVRGFNAADLEAMERLLLEADFGVPATMDLMAVLEDGVRRGRLEDRGRPA